MGAGWGASRKPLWCSTCLLQVHISGQGAVSHVALLSMFSTSITSPQTSKGCERNDPRTFYNKQTREMFWAFHQVYVLAQGNSAQQSIYQLHFSFRWNHDDISGFGFNAILSLIRDQWSERNKAQETYLLWWLIIICFFTRNCTGLLDFSNFAPLLFPCLHASVICDSTGNRGQEQALYLVSVVWLTWSFYCGQSLTVISKTIEWGKLILLALL